MLSFLLIAYGKNNAVVGLHMPVLSTAIAAVLALSGSYIVAMVYGATRSLLVV